MSGRMARNKGARGEREVLVLLQTIVDDAYGEGVVELRRNANHGRFQTSRADATGLPWLALEVKRHEKPIPYKVRMWWAQTLAQASEDQLAVLCYRANQQPWTVIYRTRTCNHTVDMATFLAFFRKCCKVMPPPCV